MRSQNKNGDYSVGGFVHRSKEAFHCDERKRIREKYTDLKNHCVIYSYFLCK